MRADRKSFINYTTCLFTLCNDTEIVGADQRFDFNQIGVNYYRSECESLPGEQVLLPNC